MLDSLISKIKHFACIAPSERVLLLTPGPHGARLLPELVALFSENALVALESSLHRLSTLPPVGGLRRVRGQGTRLPFRRHSFEAILAFETLYSIRPPWTALAEFHRVLVPNGRLILMEPSRQGFFSALRDKVSGPGKRAFSLSEIKFRLARGDYAIDGVESLDATEGMARPVYFVNARKLENAAEPAPQFLTAKEMIARRKNKTPQGEELP